MKVVKFLQAMAPYNPGETAAFSDIESDSLVMRRIAEHTTIVPVMAERSPDLDPPRISADQLQAVMAAAEQKSAGRPKA